jgi:hypothetical protein
MHDRYRGSSDIRRAVSMELMRLTADVGEAAAGVVFDQLAQLESRP